LGIASVLQSQGDLAGAMANCLEALRIDPANAEAHNNLGVSWTHQARQDEAIECFRRAIQLKPDYAHAHGNLAVSLQGLGRLDEAILHHRKAIELEPTAADLHSNYLYALNYHPDHAAASIFSEHRSWGRRHADPLTALAAPHTNDRTPLRRLRIGYVSPNFMAHAVNFFVEPILTAHDRAGFEVFCYSDAPDADETTDRLRGTADHWRDILRQPDETVAEIVRADRIDILVDLTGHISGGARMLLFARKPAPIQVTYIGYQNTTGMLAMDYRLTDEYCDPPGVTDALHTEKLVRLPTTFFCYLPYANPLPVNPLPALANGYVTFGSINNFMKITPQVLETWGRLLGGVPRSRLLVRADMTDSLRQHLFRVFGQHGVGPERLELVNRVPRLEYLELIRRIDVALDPFPFNGHTTTCDCLWQGVPVVTRSGDTYVSRFGGSGLATLGLTDWIARTPDEYIDIASRLAGDLDQLAQLRTTLRERMAASPLLDFPTFTRNLETEYRRMWTRWCAR
jgi:predicted O-linked N-acetylglucosamine transferase (SPINDLY family)